MDDMTIESGNPQDPQLAGRVEGDETTAVGDRSPEAQRSRKPQLSVVDPASPKRNGLLVLLTLAIGFVMATIDLTAVSVAIPQISINLSVPLAGLVWVVDGYTLTFAALLLAGGALADLFGAKRIYQSGLMVFLLASILCAIAPNGATLIAARLLQGLGAALFMPSSLSLLAFSYPHPPTRVKMLGIWSAMVGASSALGPFVGGILVNAFGWRSVFWVNVPIGVAGILLAQALLVAPPTQRRALSIASHGLAVLTLSALTFFLIEGPSRGWTESSVLASAVTFVASVIVLGWRERAGSAPLLPHALLSTPGFLGINGTGFLINFGAFGQLFLLTLYLQQARGDDALHAGIQLLPMMVAITAGNLLSGPLSARIGTRTPMLLGMLFASLGGLCMTAARQHTPYPLLALGVCVMNFAAGLAIPAMTTTLLQLAGGPNANGAAAALNANRQIGALVGVAVMGMTLHFGGGWDRTLTVAFAAIALAYGAAGLLVLWSLKAPSPEALLPAPP